MLDRNDGLWREVDALEDILREAQVSEVHINTMSPCAHCKLEEFDSLSLRIRVVILLIAVLIRPYLSRGHSCDM